MTTDPIADFLVQLKNAQTVRREKLFVPHSKLKAAIVAILEKEKVIVGSSEKNVRGKQMLEITLPTGNRQRVIPDFVRVSTPGHRIYTKMKDIPRPLKGMGLVVLSTPQGLMTGREAHRKGLGGEILFKEK